MMNDHFDKAPSGYFSFYDDGTIQIVNRTCCDLTGYSREDLEGKNIETIFTIATRIFFQTHFFPMMKMQGHAEEIFLSLLAKNGEHLPVLLNAKRESEEARPFIACSFIVVANRKKFEEELIAARKQAETALKENTELLKAQEALKRHTGQLNAQIQLVERQNHELLQLNHVITHSLKEPLRKILLFSDKLRGYDFPQEAAHTLERLSRSSEQMRHVVIGLQQYIWLEGEPNAFSKLMLREIIASALQRIENETGEGQLRLIQEGTGLDLEGDREQLELLFYHLFSNAIKFARQIPAPVWIQATTLKQNRWQKVEDQYRYEDFVRIEVRDEGIGFDPAASESVFELFKKLHYREGSGLGLALCKKIADNHSGVIKAKSRVNEGTSIILTLPLSQALQQDPAVSLAGKSSP